MLQIRRVDRYDLPRYPRYGQYVLPPNSTGAKVRDAVALVVVAASLESCIPPIMGVPIHPYNVSELDARQTIDAAFAERGIKLSTDRSVAVPLSKKDTVKLEIDGYNDSLQIGYEYISYGDRAAFTSEVCYVLDKLKRTASPHIATLQPVVEGVDAQAHLRQIVAAFLDSLKAQGAI
jgi:hypothetical protein